MEWCGHAEKTHRDHRQEESTSKSHYSAKSIVTRPHPADLDGQWDSSPLLSKGRLQPVRASGNSIPTRAGRENGVVSVSLEAICSWVIAAELGFVMPLSKLEMCASSAPEVETRPEEGMQAGGEVIIHR